MAFPLAALVASVVLLLALAFSFGAPQRLVRMVLPARSPHQLDGRVAPGEYRFRFADPASGIVFNWSIEGGRLLGAISSPDTGWVAVGFGGKGPLMYGADIIIGVVDARGTHLRDDFANTPTSHVPDTAFGGHDDIIAGAGLESPAGTTIEFVRALGARDSTDQPITSGPMHVIMASSESDDFMAYHVGGHKAVAQLNLFDGPLASATREPWPPDRLTDIQVLLAVWSALLLLIGAHGLLVHWTVRAHSAAPQGSAVLVAGIGVALLTELLALGVFVRGVVSPAPVRVVGSALAVLMLALAVLLILYGRAFVGWEIIQHDRDDGIPW